VRSIEVESLVKSYNGNRALNGISFSVNKGEIFGFLGPNGAGKTTTIKILSTLLLPDDGKARVCGHDVVDDPIEVRKEIGVLPERFGFYDDVSALSYLKFCGSFYFNDKKDVEERCIKLLKLVELEKFADKKIKTFSHGMRQKLGLALSMINDPELLILDEPLMGLDPKSKYEFKGMMKSLKKDGKTIFFSSHVLPEIQEACDRVCILDRGHVVAIDSVENLSQERVVFIRTLGVSDRLIYEIENIKGVNKVIRGDDSMSMEIGIEDYQTAGEINELLVKNDVKVIEISRKEKKLEDVFISLTGGKR